MCRSPGSDSYECAASRNSTLAHVSSQSITALTQLRVGLVQINPTLGDIDGNLALIKKYLKHGQEAGVHLLLFPEMIVTGYPVEDLAHRQTLQLRSARAVEELAIDLQKEGLGEIALVLGYLDTPSSSMAEGFSGPSGRPRNAAAILHRGQVRGKYFKRHLPNYGVFDEYRNFNPGSGTLVFRHGAVDVAVVICEDIWQESGLMEEVASRNPGLLAVINGSPFEKAKDDKRFALIQRRAIQVGAPLCYVNMIGGQDDLVFDGDSIVVDAAGQLIARAPQFEEGLMFVDLDCKANSSTPDLILTDGAIPPYPKSVPGVAVALSEEAELWSALVMGLRDYVKKNGFSSVVIGLSGGIDSALVAAIAVDALGAENVHGVSLPSRYSSDHSLGDAKALAINLNIAYQVIPIQPMVDAFLNQQS